MARKTDEIRNIGVIAHIDAGKTTLTERMLYYSGAKHRVGEVDKGTTETDEDQEEQERGITIYAACVTFRWKDVSVNLLDTPGHVDFTAEVERCLRVLDGAVVVFSAREGVEAQSETVWRQADHYDVPRLAFINKLDREGANFEEVLAEMASRLEANPVPIQIPVGEGPSHIANPFRGVIDLIEMKQLDFGPDPLGQAIEVREIEEGMRDAAEIWRSEMLDKLYGCSDELMELALQEEPIPADLIRRVLREATLHRHIQPVLCGSALRGIGVQPVLDAVAAYLPSPLDRPPVSGELPDGRRPDKRQGEAQTTRATRRPSLDDPFCGLVFKVLPARTGDVSWVRIYSGQLHANSRVLNPGKDKKDNVAQLWQIHATRKEPKGQVEDAGTGDIVAVIGLRHSVTGDTICDAKHPILLESIKFPETVISMAVEPETTTERKKLLDTLDMLQRQDPTLGVDSGETGQILLRGMGELHLEVIKNRLLRDFSLNVRFHKPQVSYRETVGQAVEVQGECHRQVGGQQLFAKVTLRVEPQDSGDLPVAILTRCPPEELPPESLQVVLDELRGCSEGGGLLAGFPLTKLRVTVLGGEYQEGLTTEAALRIATNQAFREGLERGQLVLLEPVMRLSILTPEEYHGDFVADLQRRRAIIVKTDNRGRMTAIEAHAPLKELFGYSSAMRSLSQGRASCSLQPFAYAPAPPEDVAAFQF